MGRVFSARHVGSGTCVRLLIFAKRSSQATNQQFVCLSVGPLQSVRRQVSPLPLAPREQEGGSVSRGATKVSPVPLVFRVAQQKVTVTSPTPLEAILLFSFPTLHNVFSFDIIPQFSLQHKNYLNFWCIVLTKSYTEQMRAVLRQQGDERRW